MGLRVRLLFFVCITMACLIVGIRWISSSQLMVSYEELEHTDATYNVDRAYRGFGQLVTDLHARSSDWASNDAAYRFMASHDASYIASIQAKESVANMRVDLVLFFDDNGRVAQSFPIRRSTTAAPPGVKTVVKALDPTSMLLAHKPGKNGFSGILRVSGDPLLISVRPILRSDGSGPARGWLLFGRYFDARERASLAARTRLDIVNYEPNANRMPRDCRSALGQLDIGIKACVIPLSTTRIGGYTMVRDVHNHGAMLMKVTMPRDIYARGLDSTRQLIQLVILTAVLFAAVVALTLEKFVLRRLSSLTVQVERVGSEGNEARVVVPGHDELGRLGDRINAMLDALACGANALKASEERLKLYNETLESTVLSRTRELEDRNRKMRVMNSVLEHAVEGIAMLDRKGRYVKVNTACAALFAISPNELFGISWEETIEPVSHNAARESEAVMRRRGKEEVELTGTRADGSNFHLHVTMVADPEDRMGSYYWFMKDVSERKAFEARIAHQAFHDDLTGLPNRALFLTRLEYAHDRLRREGQPLAVIFVDLDNFKLVNDSLGHEAGDRLLIAVAERLKACAHPSDTVARLAGDEFTLLLESISSVEEAAQIAEKVVAALHDNIDVGNGEFFLSGSAGVAFASEVLAQPDNLLRDADTAMYHAKTNGKSAYAVFDSIMNDTLAERMDIESGLRYAVERGELRVHYQPLVDLSTGRLAGVEALMRWDRPGKGIVLPGKFLAVAEETGLIVPIGYWVLEQACKQAEEWRQRFGRQVNMTMNVNLSGKQLQRSDSVEMIRAVLVKTGLPPHLLKLEITESVMMDDVDDAIRKMLKLKGLGVKLALDDFGTGYSSMANLHAFPLDTVKIDRSFIKRLGDNQEEAASVIRAIIMLSNSLHLEVTGEGIETVEHVYLLQSLGCNLGQGYYFAPPINASEITSRIAEGATMFIAESEDGDKQRVKPLPLTLSRLRMAA